MKVVTHSCSNCGQEKDIYVHEHENHEEFEGCVCNREVGTARISDIGFIEK